MKKYILPRAAIGFMAGITIANLIIILMNLGQREMMLVTPDFLTCCGGNETLAFSLQNLLVSIIAIAFAEASIAFQVEKWSFGRQYLVFCCTTTVVWVPVSLLCWFPRNIWGVVGLVSSFLLTYLINWFIQQAVSRKNVRRLNEKLREKQGRNHHECH